MNEQNGRIRLKEEVTQKTRVPLSFLVFAIINTALLVGMWKDLSNKVENVSQTALTEHQAQQWIDDARDKNPQINWPRLPAKSQVQSVEFSKQ